MPADKLTSRERTQLRTKFLDKSHPERKAWLAMRRAEGPAKFHRNTISKADWDYLTAPKGKLPKKVAAPKKKKAPAKKKSALARSKARNGIKHQLHTAKKKAKRKAPNDMWSI